MSAKKKSKTIRVRQMKSLIGGKQEHRDAIRSLGLRRIRHEVEREDTPATRGLVHKVRHLVVVVED